MRNAQRVLIGFVGWAVLLLGIVMVPYPGPGWLVVFIGLSILAREFTWARRLHVYGRSRYSTWQAWIRQQPLIIKLLFWVLTAITVVITIWLLNGYGLINDWLDLGQDWARSPFVG